MAHVRPKKYLGQHFLTDNNIAEKIVNSLSHNVNFVLEVGPGTGILTKYLLERESELRVVEIDDESISFLSEKYPELGTGLIRDDFLKMDLDSIFPSSFSIIGNFPYNISSQILFKILENRQKVNEVCGMFQKEVAERVITPTGSKKYGILSVFVQAYYSVEYLFTVNENVFSPPPKVKSAVIRLLRNDTERLNCDEDLFRKVVKTAFNQRRKVLRNSLKSFKTEKNDFSDNIFTLRPEQLSVEQFVSITNMIR